MKLLHLADLHLGKNVNGFSMIEDQRYMLDKIVDLVKERQVDAVLIAGDIYDRAIPSEEAVLLLDSFLSALSGSGAETFIISGNHDSDERLSFGSSLFEKSGIHIAAHFEGKLNRYTLTDAYGSVNIFLLPFVKASQVRHFLPDVEIVDYDDAVRSVIALADVDTAERNVIVAHQFVAGRGDRVMLGGSEGAAAQAAAESVGAVELIAKDCFDIFDYTALGHIHRPQQLGERHVRYAGSLLKYSLSEVDAEKSVPLVTLESKGEVGVELVSLKPLRELRQLRGELRQLLNPGNVLYPDDYVYVTLTDEVPESDAAAIVRQVYPRLMKLDYDNAHTRLQAAFTAPASSGRKSFTELAADFYEEMYGTVISDEELSLLLKAAKEAGVAELQD